MTTAARFTGVKLGTINAMKHAGRIRNAGHGYCYIEDVLAARKREAVDDEVWMQKQKRERKKDVAMDQVGFRARRVTHSNPIFDNGDR